MTDITIPPEALRAAARALHDASGTADCWDSMRDEMARAACLAMLEAWQTEKHKMIVGVAIDEVGGQCPAIILPLPKKESDA